MDNWEVWRVKLSDGTRIMLGVVTAEDEQEALKQAYEQYHCPESCKLVVEKACEETGEG